MSDFPNIFFNFDLDHSPPRMRDLDAEFRDRMFRAEYEQDSDDGEDLIVVRIWTKDRETPCYDIYVSDDGDERRVRRGAQRQHFQPTVRGALNDLVLRSERAVAAYQYRINRARGIKQAALAATNPRD